MAAADEDQPVGTVAHRLPEPGQVVDDRLRQQFDLAAAGLQRLRQAGGERAQVDAVKAYEKAHFPDREVYGARGRPELRLITCGGSYDRRTGYAGNTVVFAHLTATRERARKP